MTNVTREIPNGLLLADRIYRQGDQTDRESVTVMPGMQLDHLSQTNNKYYSIFFSFSFDHVKLVYILSAVC